MITALIPCYNAEPYLAKAIESVLAQTRTVDEIIIIDDCSTDDSRAVSKRYPVAVLQTPVNSGHAAARNVGINAARGDLLAWLDADDYWDPRHVEVLDELLARFPEAAVAASRVRYFGGREGLLWATPTLVEPTNVFWRAFAATVVSSNAVITRRAAVKAVNGFDETIRVAPDFDFWLRLSRHHLFVSTEEITSNYRVHEHQISARPEEQEVSIYESRARMLREVIAEGDEYLAHEMESRMLRMFDKALVSAWDSRDHARLRLLATLRRFLPRDTEIYLRYSRRSRLPACAVRLWDRLRPMSKFFRKGTSAV